MRLLCMDCEGPITLNDNAFEICAHFLPRGEQFFSLVSRYDDYCADVLRRKDYRPGTTLAFIVPFLKAHNLDNELLRAFAKETLAFVPGAPEMVGHALSLLPVYIISTSYRPYIEAVTEILHLPIEQTFSTPLDLTFTMSGEERDILLALYEELATMHLAPPAHGAKAEAGNLPAIQRLDEIFFRKLPAMPSGGLLSNTIPVGGHEKWRALRQAVQAHGVSHGDTMYVGDSITDERVLRLLRKGGGCAISFNGNTYAVHAAEFACIAPKASALVPVITAFARGGTAGVRELAGRWASRTVETNQYGLSLESAVFAQIDDTTIDTIQRLSQQQRMSLRGKKQGSLG